MTTPFKPSAIQPYFWEWVTLQVRGDLGATMEVRFKAKYRRPDQEQVEGLIERLMAGARSQVAGMLKGSGLPVPADAPKDAAKPLTDQEVVQDYLLDWSDMVGDDDQPLPYTPDNLLTVEKVLGARGAIVKTFLDTFMKAPEKNSGPQLGASTK
jgi:hypothetical protein